MAKKVNKYLVNSNHYQKEKRRRSFIRGLTRFLVIFIVFIIMYFIARAKITTIEKSYQNIYRSDIQTELATSKKQTTGNDETNGSFSFLLLAIGEEQQDSNYVPRVQLIEQITMNKIDEHTTKVIIPPSTVPSWDVQGPPLSHIYTEQGLSSVVQRTEEIMSVDYNHVVVFYLSYLRDLIDEMGKITVSFDRDILVGDQIVPSQKPVELTGLQIEQILQAQKKAGVNEYRSAIQSIVSSLVEEIMHYENFLNINRYFKAAQMTIHTDIPFELLRDLYIGKYNAIFEEITEIEMEGKRSSNAYGEVIELNPASLDLLQQLSK